MSGLVKVIVVTGNQLQAGYHVAVLVKIECISADVRKGIIDAASICLSVIPAVAVLNPLRLSPGTVSTYIAAVNPLVSYQYTTGIKVIALTVNPQPAGLHSACFIHIVGLTVDLIPAGYHKTIQRPAQVVVVSIQLEPAEHHAAVTAKVIGMVLALVEIAFPADNHITIFIKGIHGIDDKFHSVLCKCSIALTVFPFSIFQDPLRLLCIRNPPARLVQITAIHHFVVGH